MSTTTTTGTLAAGSSKTFTLAPGAAVSLTLSPNVRVTITESPESVSGSGVGGNTTRVHEPQLPGTFAYGPYAMGGVVVVAVASNSGSSVAWTRKDTVLTMNEDGTAVVSGDGTEYVLTPAGRIADTTSRDITAADNGKSLAPTGALTYTIPSGLSPMPSFVVDCPASGTVTIARSGGATLNGAGTSLTRTRASNPVGFVVLAHADTDAYGVSGS